MTGARRRVEWCVASGRDRLVDVRAYDTEARAVQEREMRRAAKSWQRYAPHTAFKRTITEEDVTDAE